MIRAEQHEDSPDNNVLTHDSCIGGLFWGQLYRLHSRSDESKVYFKDRVALALSLFEDYDVSNDWQAYGILSENLFKAGDEVNDKAARILFLHEWRKSHLDGAPAKPGDDRSGDVMLKILDKMSDGEKVSDDADTTKSEITNRIISMAAQL